MGETTPRRATSKRLNSMGIQPNSRQGVRGRELPSGEERGSLAAASTPAASVSSGWWFEATATRTQQFDPSATLDTSARFQPTRPHQARRHRASRCAERPPYAHRRRPPQPISHAPGRDPVSGLSIPSDHGDSLNSCAGDAPGARRPRSSVPAHRWRSNTLLAHVQSRGHGR